MQMSKHCATEKDSKHSMRWQLCHQQLSFVSFNAVNSLKYCE